MGGLAIDWGQFGGVISAIGGLGLAAFGVTESVGKALAWSVQGKEGSEHYFGLPYCGFRTVARMVEPLRPALKRAYGEDYMTILAQQYRADRSSGRAPDTIRQGVRLGLPFMPEGDAANLIGSIWLMDPVQSLGLARALQSAGLTGTNDTKPSTSATSTDTANMQALAGRFATALDTRVNAAFGLAEERYQARAKLISGGVAVLLAYAFAWGTKIDLGLVTPALIGLVAVPLAPVAKDLSTSLQNALTSFKSIPLVKV